MLLALPAQLSASTAAAAVVLLLLVATVRSAVEVVQPYEHVELSVLGEDRGTLETGPNVVPPFVSSTRSVDLRTQTYEAPIEATTRDGATVAVEATVEIQVEDAERVLREVDAYPEAVAGVAHDAVESALRDAERATVVDEPGTVAERVRDAVQRDVRPWGVGVEGVELEPIREVAGVGER